MLDSNHVVHTFSDTIISISSENGQSSSVSNASPTDKTEADNPITTSVTNNHRRVGGQVPTIPRLKRRRDSTVLLQHSVATMASCTLGGHLDSPTDLRDVLGSMLSDPQLHSLCDVVLIVQGERFMAHRAVLAAASCVFKAMFTNCMKERDAPEIVLSSVDKSAWRMVMQYIYNAQVDLNADDDALVLLSTARMYQLERLETFVETFLIGRVDVTNALRLVSVAEQYELRRLRGECFATMERDFEAMALSPAFICCPEHVVTRLLSSSELVLKSEMMVFEAAIRWINVSNEQRKKELDKMLSIVRLERLSEAEVKQAARDPLAQTSTWFRERVFQRLIHAGGDSTTETALGGRSHLKSRRRDAPVFTFAHTQRGMTKIPQADQEEVVRTPWSLDDTGKQLWRLKIYPKGYSKAKGHYLSMYVQARSAVKSEVLDVVARFDIFLVNRNEEGSTVSFSSHHHFRDTSDHWGFHRFLQLSQLTDLNLGYLDEESDSVIVGANLYFS